MVGFFLVLGVFIALLPIWGAVHDRRHRGDPLTGNDPRDGARRLRIEGEQKGNERL